LNATSTKTEKTIKEYNNLMQLKVELSNLKFGKKHIEDFLDHSKKMDASWSDQLFCELENHLNEEFEALEQVILLEIGKSYLKLDKNLIMVGV